MTTTNQTLDLFVNDHALAATRFIDDNPSVYNEFCRRALQAKRSGHKHYGAKQIWESMRRDYSVKSNDEKIKLNNNYPAYFARRAMKEFDELKGFFQVRNQ